MYKGSKSSICCLPTLTTEKQVCATLRPFYTNRRRHYSIRTRFVQHHTPMPMETFELNCAGESVRQISGITNSQEIQKNYTLVFTFVISNLKVDKYSAT
jgi:hypothetical protein